MVPACHQHVADTPDPPIPGVRGPWRKHSMETTPGTGDGTDETSGEFELDIATADVDELLAEYEVRKAEVEELQAMAPSLAQQADLAAAVTSLNEVTNAINAIRSTPAPEEASLVAPAPVAEDDAADSDEDADTVDQVDETGDTTDTIDVTATVTPDGEPASIEHGDQITDTPEDTTVDTPINATGDSPEPVGADSASVVEEATNILLNDGLVGAHTASVGVDARPSGPPAVSTRPVVGWEAAGGQTKFSQGRHMSFADIGEAMQSVKARRATPLSGPIDGIIASIGAYEDLGDLADMVLSSDRTPAQNSALMRATADNFTAKRFGREARTAAICEPLDILRDIPQCGEVDTPFADSLPQRPIARLGFQYIPSMSAADVADGVDVWTETDQANIDDDDSSTWKPVVDIECAAPVSVKAEEITVGARVSTDVSLSQPEHVEEFLHKLRVQRARRREQYLLTKFDGLAGGYTFESNYGAVAGLIEAVTSLMPTLLYSERLDQGDYDLVLEPGHRAKLVNDEVSRVYGTTVEQRWANIKAMISDLTGVGRIVELRDLRTGTLHSPQGAGTNGSLHRLRDVNRVRLNPASALIYGATGEEATGWQSDPQLARMNRTQYFSTEWVLLAKHGCHPAAWIDLTSCGNGARAAGIEPVDCTTQGS